MTDTTLLIPIRIDTEERKKNINITLQYILKHTDCDVIIKENDANQKLFLEYNSRIKYIFEKNESSIFHRTRMLNEMLFMVKTPIVGNYDADVLLPIDSYKNAKTLILDNDYDLVYPYGFEQLDQVKIFPNLQDSLKFYNSLNLNDIIINSSNRHFCRYGHVQFFKTESYRNGFMENENYVDWGPEDEERGLRFLKLGYKVVWFRGLVFHQEHPQSIRKNEYNKNEELHSKIKNMNKQDLINYYSKQEYLKKYATT
jgi:hypothetical protein